MSRQARPLLRFAVGTTLLIPAVACTSGNERPPTANPGPVQPTPSDAKAPIEVTPITPDTPKPEPQQPIINTPPPDTTPPKEELHVNTRPDAIQPQPDPKPEPKKPKPYINTPPPT